MGSEEERHPTPPGLKDQLGTQPDEVLRVHDVRSLTIQIATEGLCDSGLVSIVIWLTLS
jgi:hypothetical protein